MSTAYLAQTVKQALREKLHREIVPQLEELIDSLPEELTALSQAEQQLRDGGLQTARSLLQGWGEVAQRTIERPCCAKCGMPMRHKGLKPIGLVTTIGDIRCRRPRYRCQTCGSECYPHDASLRFQGHAVTPRLAKVVSRLCAQLSFGQARDNLRADYPVRLAKQTMTDIAEVAGQRVNEQEDDERQRIMDRQQPLPESNLTPDKACVFADGTTVHTEGDWHEIRVATATAYDAQDKPLARQSRARFLGVGQIAWVLLLLARSVGWQNARLRAFIADGAHWLWNIAEQYFPSAVQILDWYHLSEHVHKAARIVFGEGSAQGADWAKACKTALWEGQVATALALVSKELARVRSAAKRAGLQELQTYLHNNQTRVDYPRYREMGLPIGSGEVEAQCKTLVGARCKLAGMRNWKYAGAENVLRLRAAIQNGTYDRLWEQQFGVAA
ncbi:MAG: ISKra4 family transposase [Actinomycetota bacterium]